MSDGFGAHWVEPHNNCRWLFTHVRWGGDESLPSGWTTIQCASCARRGVNSVMPVLKWNAEAAKRKYATHD